jgi:hypothetical protein
MAGATCVKGLLSPKLTLKTYTQASPFGQERAPDMHQKPRTVAGHNLRMLTNTYPFVLGRLKSMKPINAVPNSQKLAGTGIGLTAKLILHNCSSAERKL